MYFPSSWTRLAPTQGEKAHCLYLDYTCKVPRWLVSRVLLANHFPRFSLSPPVIGKAPGVARGYKETCNPYFSLISYFLFPSGKTLSSSQIRTHNGKSSSHAAIIFCEPDSWGKVSSTSRLPPSPPNDSVGIEARCPDEANSIVKPSSYQHNVQVRRLRLNGD